MRNAFLVAWRDYAENARTKGFWIGILIFPLLIFAFVHVPEFLENKATPSRYFVLVDKSGEFESAIEEGLEQEHQKEVLQSLLQYARKHAEWGGGDTGDSPREIDLEAIPAPSSRAEDFLNDLAETNPRAVETFLEKGGKQHLLKRIRPHLREDAPPYEEPKRRFVRAPLPDGLSTDTPLHELSTALKPYFRGGRKLRIGGAEQPLYAAVLIPTNVLELITRPGAMDPHLINQRAGVEYWSANLADLKLHDIIRLQIGSEVRRREYVKQGIDIATVQKVEKTRVPFVTLNPRKEAGKEQVSMADFIRQWAPSVCVYVLWVAIFTVSQMLLSNTIEEKSNRIIEVLLSSVTAGELMVGKLVGIAGIGLTMIAAWLASLIGILWWKAGPEFEIAGQVFNVLKTSNLLPAFAIYFLLGYILYAAIILTLGSLCNTLKEAQNFMGLITVVMIVPLLTMLWIPKDPNGALATVLSWIPPYTPFVMMNRATADPPTFDVVGTMILLIVTILIVLWGSAKIFRVGILRTGQPPRLVELWRWLRH